MRDIRIAIVGHTNVGKTSLMRTLTRQRTFGEVSSRPATTRHVEMARIRLGGAPAIELFDTPGLEDSAGLLACLEASRRAARADGGSSDLADAIDRLLADPQAHAGFEQEVKALTQVRRSDVALYVIDASEPVRGRHRDELEILARCAVPVLPVLNFVAAEGARTQDWREQLARSGMHAVAAFDTSVFDERGEVELYRKIGALAERIAPALEALIAALGAERERLRRASAERVAALLVDIGGAERTFAVDDTAARASAVQDLRARVTQHERDAIAALLALHGFAVDDVRLADLPVDDGAWRDDLFDLRTQDLFGVSAGSAAAAGALAGLAVDAAVGGMSLGAATVLGGVSGFLLDAVRRHGAGALDRLRGVGRVRVDDPALAVVAARAVWLVAALLVRGHGASAPIVPAQTLGEAGSEIAAQAREARGRHAWSPLNDSFDQDAAGRRELLATLTGVVAGAIVRAGAMADAPRDSVSSV